MSRKDNRVRVGVVNKKFGFTRSDAINPYSVVIIYDTQNNGRDYDCGLMLRGRSIPIVMVDIVTEPAFAQAAIDLENAYARVTHHKNQFLGYENYPDYPSEDWFKPLVWAGV